MNTEVEHPVSESASTETNPLNVTDEQMFTGSINPETASIGTNPLNVGFALVAAFAIGLALGFFGRPQIIDDAPIQVVVTVVPDNSNAVSQAPSTSDNADTTPKSAAQSLNDANESTAASGEPTPTIMDFVMSDARHIQGDDDAPITIVEFSDFK